MKSEEVKIDKPLLKLVDFWGEIWDSILLANYARRSGAVADVHRKSALHRAPFEFLCYFR